MDQKKQSGPSGAIRAHVVSETKLIERPYRDDAEEVNYYSKDLWTLDDGVVLESCVWSPYGLDMICWDLSLKKSDAERAGISDWQAWMKEKGLPFHDVADGNGGKWSFRIDPQPEWYRVQYYTAFE